MEIDTRKTTDRVKNELRSSKKEKKETKDTKENVERRRRGKESTIVDSNDAVKDRTTPHVRPNLRTVRPNFSQYSTWNALKNENTATTATSNSTSTSSSDKNKVETHTRRGGDDNKNTVKPKSVSSGSQKANESMCDNYHEYDFSDEEVHDDGDKYKNILDQVYDKMNSNKKCKNVLSNKKWKALIESENENEGSVEEDMFDNDDMVEIMKRENDVENNWRKKKSNDDNINMKRNVKKLRTANKPTNIDTENQNVENVRKQSKKIKSDLLLPADPEPSRTQDSIAFSFSDVIINSPPPGQLGPPNRPDPRCRAEDDEVLLRDPTHLSINDLRNKRRHYFGLQSNRNRDTEVENTVIVRPVQIVTNTEICIPEIGQKRRFGLSAFEKQIPCTHTISDSDDNEKKINENKDWDEIGIKKSDENNDFESKNTDSISHNRRNNKNSFLSSLNDEPKDMNKTKKQAINPFIIPQIKNKEHDMED